MDVSAYMELHPAPHVFFNALPARRDKARFMLRQADGQWQPMTWGQFGQQVEDAALGLAALGVTSTQRVAILGHNSVAWFATALAAQAAGGVMVPVYPSSTAEQVGYVVEHSDAVVLAVGDESLLGKALQVWSCLGGVHHIVGLSASIDPARAFAAHGQDSGVSYEAFLSRYISYATLLERGAVYGQANPGALKALLDGVSLEQDGVMLYTSGTTGMPKGVPLTHANVAHNGRDWLICNGPLLDEGAKDLFWLPLSHIFGFGELCLGNTLGFVTYWSDAMKVLGELDEVRPQVFMSVPRFFEKMASKAMAEADPAQRREVFTRTTGGQLKFCLSGGAGLKREVKELFHEQGVLIIEGYGLTESSPTLTLNRPDDFRFDSVGKPLPSVTLTLAEDGEILAKGPNVFAGYHKNPEATKDTFTEDGWLKTGDIGRWTEDGFLQIIDRKKEILVTAGGKNIPPANIELRFQDDPYIAHIVVYGDSKSYLTAAVWLHDGVSADQETVQARVDAVNAQLARYETIKRFVVIEEPLSVEGGLLTPTLKIKRKKIYERYRDAFEAMYQ